LTEKELVAEFPLGFAHGLSGVGFALCLCAEVLGIGEAWAQGMRLLQIEGNHFNQDLNDWQDTRLTFPRGSGAWCHGFVGIGLARISLFHYSSELDFLERDLLNAMRSCIHSPLSSLDSLCCGNWGRVEFLRKCGILFPDTALGNYALRVSSLLLDRQYQQDMEEVKWTALFQGRAGSATVMSALISAAAPSILLFEVDE